MIQAKNLTKRYGKFTAVNNISFTIEQGEICGFLGPNGAGKTSTMRMLTGYMPATDGRAIVAGFDVSSDLLEVKKRLGYMPETTPLYTDMRVAEYLDFVAELKGFRGDAKRRKVANVMEMTGISARERQLIGSLSKGFRQRVGLAQALVSDPEVLVLDEPTIGLDPGQIIEIRSLIKDLSGKRTVILSSHILSEIQMICSRLLIIFNGQLIADDTLDGLYNKTSSRLMAKIIGPVDQISRSVEQLAGVKSVDWRQNNDGSVALEIHLDENANPRKELIRLALDRDWDIVELSSGAAESLEDVYIRLIAKHQSGANVAVEKETGHE